MKLAAIREKFLSYFEKQGHAVVDSSPLVPANDPTLLFTNAGMVQFKEVFLGKEKRSYTRATSSQRCVRAGGKHNDLDNVGYTARHHTFFEMLGNFSFGDYFKREAIQYAWQFLTKELKLPEEKLWVTVYTDDDEAADIWLKELKVSPERFSRCGDADNFWAMGDVGPCGPCSEIFYDHGEDVAGGPPGTADADGDRYVEIWNLVFMQYNRGKDGSLSPLPKPSVDTGMGLERIAAVMQGVKSNYEIDLFEHLIAAVVNLSGRKDKDNPSFKVIADHIRACAFLIVDGVFPSNEGRGYVLRRIIRRAARHGHKLGFDKPFFYQLVDALVEQMGKAYPALVEAKASIKKVLFQEEEQFLKTLSIGLKLLEDDIDKAKSKTISGEVVFKLYDTYGFPYDLTADIARERGLTVDEKGFDARMAHQKEQSKAASQFKYGASDVELSLEVDSVFCGYDSLTCNGVVHALIDAEGNSVEALSPGDDVYGVVLDKTPFYAESGGQVGDAGELLSAKGRFIVKDTQKADKAIVHYGHLVNGSLKKGETLEASVDANRRQAIVLNHSATHLLHAALRDVLGAHVQQKGSLVSYDKARFDFSHFQALTLDELETIEALVNQEIRANHLAETALMSFDEAKADGAMALFGEKYGDKVRVLTFGAFSKELCGGTHVARTGDIGLMRITAEMGIAKGVRRIEMVTGEVAVNYGLRQSQVLRHLCEKLYAKGDDVVAKLDGVMAELKVKDKETIALKAKLAKKSSDGLKDKAITIGEYQLLVDVMDNVAMSDLRTTMDKLKDSMNKGIIVLVAKNDDRMQVIAGLSRDSLGQGLSAKTLVQKVCGKGGGRDDMAQGGGRLIDDLDARLDALKEEVRSVLNG